MENESRKWLYNALSSKGYNVGKDFAEFDSLMTNNADSRKWAFETAQKSGYNVGKDYNEFEGLINPTVTRPAQPQRSTSASQPQPQQPPQPTQLPQGFGQLDVNQANRMGAGLGPVSWDQPQQEPKEETQFDKAIRVTKGKGTKEENNKVQKRMQQRLDEVQYESETGKRLKQEVLNPEWEAPTSRNEEGQRIWMNGRPITGFTTDPNRVKAHQEVMQEQAEWDALSEKDKQERMKQMQLQREMDEYEEPGFLGVTGKKLASGFINAGVGALKALEELAGGMIVEDASSPTGYSRVPEFDPSSNDAITRGLRNAGEYAEQQSRQGEPRKGASFTELLKDGDIGGFLLKGWGTGMESLPMTLSAYNPYTMALNAMSMAGNNYWQETLENPDIPALKRASYAIGTAAIEQAVEKFSDPVFKYIGGGFSKKVAKEVTEEAEKTIAKRIVNVLKDAAGEGAEEIITNFGNDALGQALDWMDGESNYGLVSQWHDYKKQNPNASIEDFALQKADENMNSFFGGALAGAYTSGGVQATIGGLKYALGGTVSEDQITANPNTPVHPITVDIAQHYDNGYSLEDDKAKEALSDRYRTLKGQVRERLGEDVLNEIDSNPTEFLSKIDQLGEETQQIVGEYISAQAGVDGMQQRIVEENRANRPNFVVNGNNIDEVDAQGNVVATHEYENADAMRAGLWELQARRNHDDVMTDINIAKVNPKYDYDSIVGAFAEEVGLDVDYIESILNKDPLELEDPESAMVTEFAEMLHNTIYGNDKVHTEQSAQDGANVADTMGIDLNNLTPEQTQQAQQIAADFEAAQQALNQAFASDEDLRHEVERLQNENMPEQGIVTTLAELGFRPDEVQAVIDYYNADAKFNGFKLHMSQKIDEEAALSRQRHTFKGTIDGVADLSGVHTITDGTNTYTLVSGNITTDPATGQITDSTSGLIIGLDDNGEFVQLSDTDGYSVLPVSMTLDQFEEAERERLQIDVTNAVMPNGPQVQPEETVEQGQPQGEPAGEEAGTTIDTGENESPAAPTATIESVTDNDGVKHYENGIAVDDAINDMEADGLDVNAESDLAINEAQAELDKMKTPKTRAERVRNDNRRKELQNIIDYYNNVKQRYAELHPVYADAAPFIAQLNQAQSRKKADEILNAALQAGVNPEEINPVHTQKVSDLITKEEERRKAEEEINDKDLQLIRQYKDTPEGRAYLLDRKRVPSAEKRRRIAELIYGHLFDADFDAVRDLRELISSWLGKGRALDPDSFGQALGWDMGVGKDASKVSTMFTARRENGGDGMTWDAFVHMVMESSGGRFDTEEVSRELEEMFRGAIDKYDLTEYQLLSRIAEAEQRMQGEEQSLADAEEEGVELEEGQSADVGMLPFAPPANEEENAPVNETPSEEEIKERQQREYDKYIKPLLDKSDKELQQMAKKKEDAVGGDLTKLAGDMEYSAIKNVLVQREIDRGRQEPNPDVMQTIQERAAEFKAEQEEKKAYGADNKLVSQDRYEELKKRMREKLLGQLNAGFDPEILQIGAEMAMFHIEAGARKFADYATRMINDLGDIVRPYLQSFYEAARRMPGMEELRKEMDSTEAVDNFDVLSYDKQPTNTVNEHKEKDNVSENVVSSQQETSEEVGRKAEDADKYRAFSQAVADDMLKAMETGEKPYKSIKDIRSKAKSVGLEVDDNGRTDILLQELVEDGLVSAARQYVNTYVIQQMLAGKTAQEARTSRDLFNDIVKLYGLQPSISQRSSNRIKMGQYSTPLPMSFIADAFAFKEGMEDVLEPTAGNGMMVFAVPESKVHANELDKTRLDNLKAQKFKEVTDQDATQPFEGEQYDAIIANPPFGSAEAKDYDGKMISGLAEQIALNALSKMKDNGRAAIIIGGNMEYGDNGAIKSDRAFFTYLYDHYNVKAVIDMDGKLFSKQGTTWATRMILIDGRRSEEERAQSKIYPPVKDKAPKKATTFEELYDISEEIINNNSKTNGNEVLRTSGPVLGTDNSNTSGQTNGKRRSGQPDANGSHAGRSNGRVDGQSRSDGRNQQNVTGGVQQPSGVVSGQTGAGGLSAVSGQQPIANEPATGTNNGGGSTGGNGRVQSEGSGNVQTGGRRNERVEEKRELTSDKLPYRPHNTAFSLESVAPASMVEAMDNTLKSIEQEYGDIDNFVTKELGYDSVEEMHNALAAEQVDSVAMAIWNMKKGEGMIIGDQTGVGKGRQMAALIRWACKQGKKPIFVTKDSDLFSDIYRDLVDIGSGDLRPFIFNASKVSTDKETGEKKYEGGFMLDVNGHPIYRSLGPAEQARIFKTDKLPQGYDYAVLSYTQMNTGDAISQEESGKVAKERGERGAKKGKAVKAGRPTPKADYLRRIAKDNYLLMDESQNAAGSGNTGAYFQSILKDAKAVTFASATFAKRPDTMPLYAIRTAISKAKVKTWELLMMIGKGGVTLQEIMSRAMTQAGQMVRRERDMSDVRTDWKTIDDKETAEKARRNYDNVMRAFNAIIDFQDNYIKPALAAKSMEFASMASSVSSRRGTEKAGVDNPPFVNRLYNFSKQLLLSLKVDAVVDEVAKEIEAGRHPVIALENTLESALGEYGVGDVIEDPTLFGKLKKGLDATFRYTLTDEDGNETGGELQPHELGSEGEQAYYDLVDLIKESTQGMFISPLDAITDKLENKGYRVGEISGRKTRAVLNDEGQYVVRKRENTDRKKLARDFNSGAVDVLIINKTGSTGISLHASKRFSDQRQRTMIMAQPLSDINDYMQMIGRIDRTGQVHRGYYINLGLPVPAETRFMMMLANKLKSLNANTTTSQENKDNDVDTPDLLNKYGDQVMVEYLRDNPDVYRKLGEFLRDGKERGSEGVSAARLDEYQPKEGDAKQITGRVALLSVDEQDAFYDDVTRRYNELIKYLDDTGSNDLKISVLPLNARTIDREVSSEGTAPDSGNPFADNAYVEWVDMDILKKPMKAADVGKTIEQLNPEGKVEQIISTVKKETQAKLDKENERYEAAKKRTEEDIAAKAEVINNQQKRTEDQKKEAIEKYASEKRKSVEESHNNMVNKIDANNERLMRYLNMFKVGDSVLVPDDLTTDSFLGSSNGIFCGFKAKDEGITPSTTLAVFATLDGRRKIEVKLSDWAALSRINNMTEQNWDAAHEVTLSNWDEKIPSSSRKHGYIMTGNILQAISDTNFQGRLITFTDNKGNVRDGVLMPDKWEPSQLKGSTVPISARKERITSLPMKESVTSSDGRVTITRYWGFYTLDVPKSKKQGGEYYLDKTLLNLVEGNDFFTAGGKMRGRVDNSNINAVIDRLGEMSVTLPSDKKVEFKETEENSPNRMITTSNPMEAIEQAAESWRQQNGKPVTGNVPQEIKDFVDSLPTRFGLNGGAPTYVINSREDLENLKGNIKDRAWKEVEKLYNEPDAGAAYIPRFGFCVVFGEKLEDAREGEIAWWHEQAHGFWQRLPEDVRKKYGEACFEYLRKNNPSLYNHIKNGYKMYEWYNEACSYLIGEVIGKVGTEKFLSANFVGNEEICNFANELRNYIENGREESNNQLRRDGVSERDSEFQRRSSQGRERGSDSLRTQEEQVTDPLKAIELSANRWKKAKEEREKDMDELREDSERMAYEDRLNTVAYVNNEAFHDSMAALKVGQEEIAHHEDIPDSQNAYMAENLMHGKNKVEMDGFNIFFRNPLFNAFNKVLAKMEWTMKEMNQYLFTKHGLERNRELFARDWFVAERKKRISEYSELNTDEREIFDKLAERIETDFEDGKIDTEEEKQRRLSLALQKAHKQYLDDLESKYYAMKADNYDKLMRDEITLPEYYRSVDDFIVGNMDTGYKPEDNDYSGLTAMYGDEEGKYKEAEIMAQLVDDEKKMGKEDLDELWNRINAANEYGLDKYIVSGMRSEEEIDKIRRMFNWYVPMRGFEEETAEDVYQYFTSNDKANSYVGGLIKQAKGRKSKAKAPLATMLAMGYKAIKDCNQNTVNQKFYRLCQAHPNDLTVVSDAWAEWNEEEGQWVEVAPEFPADATEDEIRQMTLDWEDNMRRKAMGHKARKINGKADFIYRPINKKNLDEHIVDVMMNGRKRRVTVVGNPRMAQALNGHLRYSEGDGIISKSKWLGWAAGLNRSFLRMRQAVSTNYSLNFVWRNAKRDWTHFGSLLATKEGLDYARAAEGYYFKSLFGMRKLFKKYREGTLDESDEKERDFKDFMDNGGITGFVQMQKVDEIEREFEKLSKKMNDKGEIKLDKGFWDKVKDAIEAYNEAIENRARFATYRASRHHAGRTKARSAYDAKEVTANFNRRGAGKKTVGIKGVDEKVLAAALVAGRTSQTLNENRMFFNATVQSVATLGEGIKVADNKTRAKIFAKELAKRMAKYGWWPFVLYQLVPLMNEALISLLGSGDDDDPYANLPEWVRRNNFCLYVGHGNFFTFALGQELAAFYSLGDIIAGMTYYPELKPVDKTLTDEIVGILSVFSPVDMETKVTDENKGVVEGLMANYVARVYSNAAPLVQIGENISWTGRPIYREDKFPGEEFDPEFKMAYRGTAKFYKYVSQGLNYLGGGDDGTRGAEWLQINPGTMEYLVEQYLGGVGRAAVNTGDVAGDVVNYVTGKDQDFNVRKLEGVRALFQQSDDRTQYYRAQAKYWKYHKEADKLDHDLKFYIENAPTNPDYLLKVQKLSTGVDAARLQIIEQTESGLSKIRKAINSTEGQDRKELQKLYNRTIKTVVNALDDPENALNNLPVQ